MAGNKATAKSHMYACNYCTRPIKTATIMANDKLYCGKLCAAMGLIAEVHKEDEICEDHIELWAESIIENICCEDSEKEIAVPIKVRWSQAADVEELHSSASKGLSYFVVPIDDKGTPDWENAEPGPCELALNQCDAPALRMADGAVFHCTQSEIDRVVDGLLRNGDEPEEGRP